MDRARTSDLAPIKESDASIEVTKLVAGTRNQRLLRLVERRISRLAA